MFIIDALQPRTMPCDGRELYNSPTMSQRGLCPFFATVRIGARYYCRLHAVEFINAEAAKMITRIHDAAKETFAQAIKTAGVLILAFALAKGTPAPEGPKGPNPNPPGGEAQQEVCPQTLPECRR